MDRAMHFGVTLPQIKRSWEETREAAVAFDDAGFDSVWVCDHVYGVPLPNLPIFEAWSLLAAVGALTRRVELGTLVTPPFFRNPAVLAKQVSTIDHVSGGRVIVGLGAFPPLGRRMVALEECARILRGLFSEERFSFEGQHFKVSDALCEPKPRRRTPILVGGGGEKVLMGIAARHADIWNNMAVSHHLLAGKIEALRRRCDEEKRDFGEITVSQQCVVVIAETEDEAKTFLEKAGRIYGGHMGAHLAEHGIWGTPDRVVECLERHRRLGCTGFIIEFFGRDTRVPARLFAERVLPAFRD